jgi:hypothetical protein
MSRELLKKSNGSLPRTKEEIEDIGKVGRTK